MPDGIRLAARIWLPEDAGPVPAILEYIPYRKRDLVRARDERNHPFFASHGYVCLRVDMRGSGDSEGVMRDMYGDDELADARHVIEWIAAQDWCNGRVGMFGTSWGGTASLQAAVDAPKPLKAVIANCATIDRFEDDIHWMGGCVLTDTLEWAATLPAILAAPPDSATVGEGWFQMWQKRLAHLTFPHENWLRETRREPYWRRGSVRFEAERLSCPILAIGGWSDRYSNSVMPLVRARPDICRGIVGPWGHHYPDQGEPGPTISFQDVALDWWDHWLKGDAKEMPVGPVLRVWRRSFDPPQDRLAQRNGQWIEMLEPEPGEYQLLFPCEDGLTFTQPESTGEFDVPFDIHHGQCAGDTGYFGRVGGLPLDQADDDDRAICFDTVPLATPLAIFGHVDLSLGVVTDRFPAQLACRLCDVASDGRSNLITRTVVNLELDNDLNQPRDAATGQSFRARIRFPTTAYQVEKGHVLRLALGAGYWPLVVPVNARPDIRIATNEAELRLPIEPKNTSDLTAKFPPASDLPKIKSWSASTEGPLERTHQAKPDGSQVISWRQPRVSTEFDQIGVKIWHETRAEFFCPARDTTSATCTIHHGAGIERSDGTARIESTISLENGVGGMHTKANIRVFWNDELMASHEA